MTTFADLQAFLRGRYRLARDETGEVALGFDFPATGERQLVSIRAVTALERPWLVLVAEIGGRDVLPSATALARNAELAVGAIALAGDRCVVRYACPMGLAPWPDLEMTLGLLAREAVELRRAARPPSADALLPYAD